MKKIPFVIIQFERKRSDEIYKYAIEPAIKSALNLSDNEVKRIRIDQYIQYDYTPGKSMPLIPQSTLTSIEDCLFVVCDTTGNRPNCYFELGYALAHQKYVILVHDDAETEPHFDLSVYPYYFYDCIDDLKSYLKRKIEFVFGKTYDQDLHKLSDFFERCGLPIVSLEGDKNYEYHLKEFGSSQIQVEKPTIKFRPPKEWISKFNKILKKQLEYSDKQGNVIWNGDLVRVKDYHPRRDENTGERFLRIETEHTDYFTFITTNHAWRFLDEKDATNLRDYESVNIINLRDSVLSNPLTVSLSLVVEHRGLDWIIIQERNIEKAFHAKQRFQCSAAGMVSLQRDNSTHGIDVFATAKNELEEELGIKIREDKIAVRGLIRETRSFEVGIIAEARIRADPEEILRPSADSFEVKNVYACRLTPEHIAEFIKKNGGIDEFVPLGLGAIIFSLMRTNYSYKKIENSMKTI